MLTHVSANRKVMERKVHAVHFTADRKLIHFVNERVDKLKLFFDHIVSSEVFLKLEPAADKANKVAEVRIVLPGKELFARKQSRSFEQAADEAVEALRRQVKKYKGRVTKK
jgi:putative sigma-54 modulation protein